MPDANPLPDILDSVLKKYGRIWIWSILSAAVAALSLRSVTNWSIMQANAFGGYGVRSQAASYFFLSLAAVVPSIATLVAVWYLLLFLRHHIVPILFPEVSSPEPNPDMDVADAALPDGAQLLCRTFGAILIAMASELAIALSSIIYRAMA